MEQQDQSTPELFEEISHILSLYPVGSLKEVVPTSEGAMNDNWIVETDEGKYFLKRRNTFFTSDSIDFELKLIEYILSHGFPTARLIHTNEDTLNVFANGRNWELYEFIPGDPFQVDNFAQIESAARLLARFHKAAAGYQGRAEAVPNRKIDMGSVTGMVDELKEQVNAELKTSTLGSLLQPGIMGFIESQAEIVINGIQPLSGSLLTIIHGDFQPSNVIFRGNDAAALIDFGNAALSYRSYDVAKAILSFSALKPNYDSQNDLDPWLNWDRVRAFFGAYHAEIPLSETDIEAMPALIRGTFLVGVGFYMNVVSDMTKKASLLINAFRFISWLDGSETELKDILHQEGQASRERSERDEMHSPKNVNKIDK